MKARQAFTQQLKETGATIPPDVSLDQLISRGLLTSSDVNCFAGTKVTLATDTRNPGQLFMRIPDAGRPERPVAMIDGSVQQVSR